MGRGADAELSDLLAGADPAAVAVGLLGCVVSHETPDGPVAVRLTEVEAYAGADDPASHAWRGPTPRNGVMSGAAGFLYVYLSHGVHWCANVVCGVDGTPAAVLLRAGAVVDGHDLARTRRGPRPPDHALARGPGCLTRSLGIDGSHAGADLLAGGPLRLVRGRPSGAVLAGPRVGVSRAADVPWRFRVSGEPSVSAYSRSPRAPR